MLKEHVTTNPSNVFDPLLECLLALAKYYGHHVSANALTAHLPLVNHQLTPQLFIEAAERIQINAHIIERSLDNITNLVLPIVLLLKNNKACLLTQLYDDGTGEFIIPEKNGSKSKRLSLAEVKEAYMGISIYVKPAYHFEKRADEYEIERPKSWFWDTLFHYRYLYYHVALASVFINCFVIAAPLFVMNVYDRVVPNHTFETLWALTVGITIIYIFDFILKMIRSYLIDVAGKKADIILSDVLFTKLLNLQLAAKPVSSGAFANNFHGFEAVRDFFTSATLVSFIDLPFIALFILVIAYIGGWIALIPLFAVPIVIVASLFLEVPIRSAIEQIFVGAAQKHAILVESIERLETIKTSQAQGEQLSKWEYYTSLVARLSMKSHFYSSLAINFTSFILQMVYVLVIVAGVYAIFTNSLTLGGLIAIAILSSRALAPLTQIASLITRYHHAKAGLKSLNHIMLLPIERHEIKHYIYRGELNGDIEFNNVSFTYPHQQLSALNNISFKIKAKEKVAILGRIGSGKSTILKLILKLYEAKTGSVLLDGIDLNQLDPADIRRNIGYVPQESGLFYGTLRENICKAAPWATQDEIMKATEITGIDYYIKRHPTGFDLMVGENGAGLSAGQQQTIAMARALLMNPPLLLFDDATSEMDDNTEADIRSKLETYIQDKTFILVTHKLSMLSLVDRILIIQDGKLVKDGPKQDILKLIGY